MDQITYKLDLKIYLLLSSNSLKETQKIFTHIYTNSFSHKFIFSHEHMLKVNDTPFNKFAIFKSYIFG